MMQYKEQDSSFEPIPALANYTIFYSFSKKDYENMQSICYLTHNTRRDFGHTTHNSFERQIKVEDAQNSYYMNVLANMQDSEQYAYSPFEIVITRRGTSMFVLFLSFILIIFLGYAVFYLYKKYTATKKRLDYEMQDVRNMANVTKTDEQINDMNKKRQSNKYATLTEESNVSKI
jgi:hypothetical protein